VVTRFIKGLSVVLLLGLASQLAQANELNSRLEVLATRYSIASKQCNFSDQLRIAQEMLALAPQLEENRSLVLKDDIELRLSTLRSAINFSSEEILIAQDIQRLHENALREFNEGNLDAAADRYQKALEKSRVIYASDSIQCLQLTLDVANTWLEGYSRIDEAQVLAEDVLNQIEALGRTNSTLYRYCLIVLTGIYIAQDDLEKALSSYEKASSSLEKLDLEASLTYLRLQGATADFLNRHNKFDSALACSRKALNAGYIPQNSDAVHYGRTLREYARAKIGLKDFDRVPEAYQEAIRIAESTPGYPKMLLLEHLEEYRDALKKLESYDTLRKIESKILELRK